ncbi:MAG: acyl-CoA desaturase [Solirubrobacterales bacterium]|jgi:stearoyl-CoA desaturase (delta-9 desaturase)|nr:acyl-CoA desaturase [Solirubrobacterales bacterium]
MQSVSTTAPTPTSAQMRDDVQPSANESLDRFLTGLITVLPFLGLGVVGWQLWNSALGWSDVIVFAIVYTITTLGITVGFHRMLTHRAFETSPLLRGAIAAAGSAAIEGPVISWVADHRKHHAFSDQEGDPHSPHVDHGHGLTGALRGLFHAHVGWLFKHDQRALKTRYAKDLLEDPVISYVNRTFFLWVAVGLIVPFFLGWAIGGSLTTGLTGMLWGGLVRMLVLHHVTYSINSLCHFFGRKDYDSGDESRNLAWLAPLSMGESWHNNHHAFPTSAAHGLRWWQVDVSALVIRGLERVGLVWNVVRISPERQAAKATPKA